MIKIIVKIINNKLIGHLEICESELGEMFAPIVIPIMVKPKFLSKLGIENFNPKKAPKEQTMVGPKRNGAGKLKYQAKTAPNNPRIIEVTNSMINFLFKNLGVFYTIQ